MSELREVPTKPFRIPVLNKKQERLNHFEGKKILLVEDNELNREIVTEILQNVGFEIDAVDDGDIAVYKMKYAKRNQYDLILMDIQMQRMDGYVATREIRTLPDSQIANIPIIAMTANAFEEDKKNSFRSWNEWSYCSFIRNTFKYFKRRLTLLFIMYFLMGKRMNKTNFNTIQIKQLIFI